VLFVGGRFECFSMEDVVREIAGKPVSDWKVAGQTAIPYGEYVVDLTFSPKYQKIMPILVAVPGFTGIRIHSGNVAEHTEGCLLVGKNRVDKNPATEGIDTITESKLAFGILFDKLASAHSIGEPIVIEIRPVG
jgi:hypothetical protein